MIIRGPTTALCTNPVFPAKQIKCDFSSAHTDFNLHIPFAMLLVFLELQTESQQSQRPLYAGLSRNCQLIKEGGKGVTYTSQQLRCSVKLKASIWFEYCRCFVINHLPMLLIVTGLFGAVQPIWICCHQHAVDKHLRNLLWKLLNPKPAPIAWGWS